MSTAVAVTDLGPAARFVEVTRDPQTPEVIVQRLAEGETLRSLAKSWGIPYLRFIAWVAANADLTEQCKRVTALAGIELRMEGLEIVDAVEGAESSEQVAAAKLRAEYRERLSRDLNRPLFGKHTQHTHTLNIDLGERLRRARERGRVIDQAPEAVTLGADHSPAAEPAPTPAPADEVLI